VGYAFKWKHPGTLLKARPLCAHQATLLDS
jgi:hypothetical protein